MKKQLMLGILALSLTCSAGIAGAKGGNGSNSSGGSNKSEARQDSPRESTKTTVERSAKTEKSQTTDSIVETKRGTPKETQEQIKERIQTEVRDLTTVESKERLKQKKEQLAKQYQIGQREQLIELGQYYKVLGDTKIKAFVNGQVPTMDVEPFVQEGRAMVPLRAIVASLKAEVTWDAETQTITVIRGDKEIQLQIGSDAYTINGEEGTLDVAAMIKNGRTFLPLRAISELLGAKVDYIEDGNIAVIEDEATLEDEQTVEGDTGVVEEGQVVDGDTAVEEDPATTNTTNTDESTVTEDSAETVPTEDTSTSVVSE